MTGGASVLRPLRQVRSPLAFLLYRRQLERIYCTCGLGGCHSDDVDADMDAENLLGDNFGGGGEEARPMEVWSELWHLNFSRVYGEARRWRDAFSLLLDRR